nr:hypothetical protein [uncultured Desulfobacter sp.]
MPELWPLYSPGELDREQAQAKKYQSNLKVFAWETGRQADLKPQVSTSAGELPGD